MFMLLIFESVLFKYRIITLNVFFSIYFCTVHQMDFVLCKIKSHAWRATSPWVVKYFLASSDRFCLIDLRAFLVELNESYSLLLSLER